jgi:hypothetical protein
MASLNRAIAVALCVTCGAALAQSNPAARGASTAPGVAQANRVRLATTEHGVNGLSPFDPGCGNPGSGLFLNSEVEPHLVVNPLNPNHFVAAWQQDRWADGGSRGLVSAVSFDRGATWSLRTPAFSSCAGGTYTRASDPWLAFAADGALYAIAIAFNAGTNAPNAVLVARSADGGLSWASPVTLDSSPGANFSDKETITADPHDSRFVYAVWDRITNGAGVAPIAFARTVDGGASWEASGILYDPFAETIGNLIRVLPDGTLVDLFAQTTRANFREVTTLRTIRSTDHGATWSDAFTVSPMAPLGVTDPVTQSPVRDGSEVAEMAVAPDGTLFVVWQDARFSSTHDGIALAKSTDGGQTWSTPVRVNADPSVAAFTPQVHVRADGMIAVTYFDLRPDTSDPATFLVDYWLTRSFDGINWSEMQLAGPFDLLTAPRAGGLFLGDYMGLASSGDVFIPLYVRTTGSSANRSDVFVGAASAPLPRAALASYRADEMPAGEPDAKLLDASARHLRHAKALRHPSVEPVR